MYSRYPLQTQPSTSHPQIIPPNTRSRYAEPSSGPQLNEGEHERGTDLIGQPIHFSTGQYSGRTIRMELQEIQKAELGRKYARVDRRPLDPPPVVLLKMYEVENVGTARQVETEIAYDSDIQVLGLLCTVDLFPVPGPEAVLFPSGHDRRKSVSASSTETCFCLTSSPPTSSIPHTHSSPQESSLPSVSPPRTPPIHFSGYIVPEESRSDAVHYVGDFPIKESSKMTQALVGATFIQPAIVDYQGSKAIVFAFADLAVKIEGSFILRYRVFDIYARTHRSDDLAITAETYGGTFRVYSTKEFPGLSASTELTKHLARWGLRLNIRESERRRKRPASGGRSPTPGYDG